MIVVIGAGLIGLGIAFELARRGASVRVIEAGEPGAGASWAAAGMLAPYTETLASGAYELFCSASLERYPEFVRVVREAGGVDPRLRLGGILEAAYDVAGADSMRGRVLARSARGIPAKWLSREEAHALEPALGADVVAAAFSPAEGHVDNRRLGRALRAACDATGVRIDTAAEHVAVEADARRVLGVRTPAGFVPATVVVNAAGAWAGLLEGVPAAAQIPVVPIKGQMLALAMPAGLVRRVVWVPGAYLVPRDDRRLLVGATVEDVGFNVRVTARGIRGLLDAALAALPALGELTLAETWAGLRPGTPDGLPFLGETALAGYIVAAGHYRNGVLLTPQTAHAIADLLEGRGNAGIAPFSPARKLQARAAAGEKIPL